MKSDILMQQAELIRPVVGLTRGLSVTDLEILTVDAIRTHRILVDKADKLFQALPDDYKTGKTVGGSQHLCSIEASIAMHAQQSVVNTLIIILGYIPDVSLN
ncbi:transcriptional repressor TraM (plasmid) [Agrobacterium sp. rho-8.1]|nr:transcriptional repressor TraM [Agrobacterium sp. rho-8.1]